MKAVLTLLFVSLLGTSSLATAAQQVPVNIKKDAVEYRGDLFLPDNAQKPLPLVVVIHEWWGKTDYPLMRARKVADELGYAALAVDLFGNGKTAQDPTEATRLTEPFYKDSEKGVLLVRQFVASALNGSQGSKLDGTRVGVIGYCFGGGVALNVARAAQPTDVERIRGVVAFHAPLASSLKAMKPLQPKVLVLHGEADKMVKPDEVTAFKAEMKQADAALSFYSFPGASHAFTNPKATENGKKFNIPIAYNRKADVESWKRMTVFLKGLFAPS